MTFHHRFVARMLLIDGILLIILAFFHLLATPLIHKWFIRELTSEALMNVSAPFLTDHIIVGVLLIPFAVSTLYSASGVRTGQSWARGIALTNALAITLMPFIVLLIMGPRYFGSLPFIVAAASITLIGLTMFIPLLWLDTKDKH